MENINLRLIEFELTHAYIEACKKIFEKEIELMDGNISSENDGIISDGAAVGESSPFHNLNKREQLNILFERMIEKVEISGLVDEIWFKRIKYLNASDFELLKFKSRNWRNIVLKTISWATYVKEGILFST